MTTVVTDRPVEVVTTGKREREALALTSAVVLGLLASRWGSHLGIKPLYLTDVLLAVGTLHAVAGHLVLKPRPLSGVADRANPGILLGLFLGWVVLRLVTSPSFNLTAMRDAAPYLYAVVAFVAASSYARSNAANRARTVRLLTLALLAHLAWCALVVFVPSVLTRLPLVPGSPVGFLSLRGDSDAALVGILTALALARVLQGRHAGRWTLVLLVCALTIARLNSRSGLLAGLAVILVVFIASVAADDIHTDRRKALVALLPLLIAGIVVSLPATNPGQRLLGTFAENPSLAAQANAVGTTRARTLAWKRVVRYTETSDARIVGVGFGPDFLTASGAEQVISGGREGVRSPHNWFVGTYARLGLIGAGLAALLALAVLGAVWRVRRRLMGDDLLLLSAIIAVGTLTIGAFGVVLESPFGAVPFYWAAGILLAKPVRKHLPSSLGRSRVTRTSGDLAVR